jgi:hypothetical protein
MAVCLLEALERGQFDVALFLTYTLNLRFFEQLVLPRLRRTGVGWIGILADEKGYRDSLADPLSSDECGSAYAVGTPRIRLAGLQHAKVVWLQGREHEVYVGSHNLTISGFNDQAELTTCLKSSETAHIEPLRELHAAIAPLIPESLVPVWARIRPPEVHPASSGGERTVWALSSLMQPLREQLAGHVGSADHIGVVSPFLDAGALGRLAAGVGAGTISLGVPDGGADTPLVDVAGLPQQVTFRRATGPRPLHAKAYEFWAPDARWAALGSANCTSAALERSALEGGNFEILVLARGGEIPTTDVAFEDIADPALYPGTGRRWDDDFAPRTPLTFERAEYAAGELVLSWRLDQQPRLRPGTEARLRVLVDDSEVGQVALASGTAAFALSGAPRTVALEFSGEEESWQARAWVMVPDRIAAQAARAHVGRWRDFLAGADPLQHVSGAALCLEDMLRTFVRLREGGGSGGRAGGSATGGPHPRPHEVAASIEVFQYSPDPIRIRQSVERFLDGPAAGDPLAVLRALLARSAAPPPTDVQDDASALDRHEQKRRAAQRRWGEALAHHLRRVAALVEPLSSGTTTDVGLLAHVLGKTFGAAVLISYFGTGRGDDAPRSQVAEAFIALLETLGATPTAPVLTLPRVAGPLALCFGAVADAISDDVFVMDRLRRHARSVIGDDPRPAIDAWRVDPMGDAPLMLADARGRDLLASWLPPTLLLFGIAPERTRARQQQRWGALLDLQRADIEGRPERVELDAVCSERYAGDPIWALYKGQRSRGRLPAVIAVRDPVCSACRLALPELARRQLRRGEAVVCPTGRHALVFAT